MPPPAINRPPRKIDRIIITRQGTEQRVMIPQGMDRVTAVGMLSLAYVQLATGNPDSELHTETPLVDQQGVPLECSEERVAGETHHQSE